MTENFSNDIEIILENIRLNSILLSKEHKKRYLILKNNLKYFRLPVIIISAINSIIAIGGSSFINQSYISLSNCLLSLSCGVIGSIELYFGIKAMMEVELNSSKDFYVLATDIYTMLSLNISNRQIDGRVFLDDCYSRYVKLIGSSCIVKKKIEDKLAPLPKTLKDIENISKSSSSDIDKNSDKSSYNNI